MEQKFITQEDLRKYEEGRNCYSDNKYILEWFELMPFHEDKIVIYGTGKWYLHIMDWRGCNFYHGRLPLSPVFNSEEEAINWLTIQVENKVYYESMALRGHHAGEFECSICKDRKEIKTIYFSTLNTKGGHK